MMIEVLMIWLEMMSIRWRMLSILPLAPNDTACVFVWMWGRVIVEVEYRYGDQNNVRSMKIMANQIVTGRIVLMWM